MEIKQLVVLEATKNGKVFSFSIPSGPTWGEVIDASYEILQQVNKMSQENIEQMKKSEQEQKSE